MRNVLDKLEQYCHMIRKDLIERKISLIQDDLARLAEFAHHTFDDIAGDFVKQAAMERMLERIISRAIDINEHLIIVLSTKDSSPPKDYRETFLRLAELGVYPKNFAEEIGKSIGVRNLLVHEYDKVDQMKVYDSIKDCLKDYTEYIDYIRAFVKTKISS